MGKSYDERVEDMVFSICESLVKTRPEDPLLHMRRFVASFTGRDPAREKGGRGEASRVAEYLVDIRPCISAITAQLLEYRPTDMRGFILEYLDDKMALMQTNDLL
eukprot:TRINITY_DN923_c0_g1_i4.p3 TRINITY_DN923_c0_g1~~TRINITY_DN923_c0_g1_i4.p3  ORF type:complete len:105 (-),score=13.97 TRINITY_DN923_c0_g1_i4:563-877(-)